MDLFSILFILWVPNFVQSFVIEKQKEISEDAESDSTKISPEKLASRKASSETAVSMAEMWCNSKNAYAPCSCKEIITTMYVHTPKGYTLIEFPEYTCDQSENDRRGDTGRIISG